MNNIISILNRDLLLKLYLDFVFKKNSSDIRILVTLKDTFETSKSLIHISVVLAYSFMLSGTADDNFFRTNTTWFMYAKKWAQFTTAAALGVIHIGHLSNAQNVLENYLKKDVPEHVLSGALYALGLIYANYIWNNDVIAKIHEHLNLSSHIVVQHGASLALGLISMGSRNMKSFNALEKILEDDKPEPGEAAGYALGMVMLGSGDEKTIDIMLNFAEETKHEKIIRGLAMGLGFVMYGKGKDSKYLSDKMLKSRQSLIREGGVWIISLANVGNSSNEALQSLLYIAVSDVSDHVRRAAVIGIGFVLSRRYKEVPSILNLLAKSYHHHVRCGAALAIGISCAGTGYKEAIDILKPLLDDNEDIVKQNAYIAMAMVMQQQSDARIPFAKEFRKYLRSLISRKRNEVQIFGICCSLGILNAGGRNVVISCNSLRGENSVSATVGLALFCNHFFWHPLALMLPLAFHPTSIIGLDKDLKPVDWNILSNEPPSFYSYPPLFESENPINVLSNPATLSISNKNNFKNEIIKNENQEEEFIEENYQILPNMSRITLEQINSIKFDYDKSYIPITGQISHGFIMLKKNFEN